MIDVIPSYMLPGAPLPPPPPTPTGFAIARGRARDIIIGSYGTVRFDSKDEERPYVPRCLSFNVVDRRLKSIRQAKVSQESAD